MSIKNFTVKTKQVKNKSKGLNRQLRYIHDDKAPSHKKTKITPLLHGTKLEGAYDERRLDRQVRGIRGGGVVNRATRFIITVPNSIAHPTKKQWSMILKECLTEVSKINKIPLKTLGHYCEAVIHNEEESGKHSHIHLVISNIIEKEYCKGITQKRTTYAMKTALNRAIKSTFGLGPEQYRPKKKKPLKTPKKTFLGHTSPNDTPEPTSNRKKRKRRFF